MARDDAGERAAQIGREFVLGLIAMQLQGAHRLVRYLERVLKLGRRAHRG
jgi:hypothetical protein